MAIVRHRDAKKATDCEFEMTEEEMIVAYLKRLKYSIFDAI
jgi:hypothetical protein